MRKDARYEVTIYCKKCGERYLLRGSIKDGAIETGFKKCICENDRDFKVKSQRIVNG